MRIGARQTRPVPALHHGQHVAVSSNISRPSGSGPNGCVTRPLSRISDRPSGRVARRRSARRTSSPSSAVGINGIRDLRGGGAAGRNTSASMQRTDPPPGSLDRGHRRSRGCRSTQWALARRGCEARKGSLRHIASTLSPVRWQRGRCRRSSSSARCRSPRRGDRRPRAAGAARHAAPLPRRPRHRPLHNGSDASTTFV